MKKGILAGLVLTFAIVILGAACNQVENNHNTMMNHNGMNNNSMPMNSNMNHTNMNHSQMETAPNAANAPYDLQFIDTMVAHHTGAVEMAKMVEGKTQNPDMKKFAGQIVTDQEKEINQMKEWREKWFAGKPSAINMEMPGMADSMKMDMSKLSTSKDKEFDLAFIEMMIPHHQGAITMSKEALQKSEKPEIKTLAAQIIKAQEAEIKMMEEWKAKWAK